MYIARSLTWTATTSVSNVRTTLLPLELWGLLKSPLPHLFFGTRSASTGSSTSGDMTQTLLFWSRRRVQGVPLPEPRWLSNLCECPLEKDQEGLPVPARGSSQLGNPPGAPTSGPPRVWSRSYSEQGDHDPILPKRPEAFRPGPVRYPRVELRFLGRGRRESRQCRGKGVTAILLQYLRHGLKVSPREQAHQEGREKLR